LASVLRGPEVDVSRLVGVSDPLLLDPSWQQMLDEARAEAHRAGFEEGRRAAREQFAAEASVAAEAVQRAVDSAFDEMRRLKEEAASSLLTTALELLGRIVGDLPVDPAHLVGRIRAALDELDSPRLEVRVASNMADLVAAGLADDDRVTVAPDPALGDGEARIVGDWCDADLTLSTALSVLREVVGG
jgi:flagellar biosynthesis/type III secretory pathway protein FliH